MLNVNPWLISGAVLSVSGIIFRLWLGNTMVSVLLALILALAAVPLIKAFQAKSNAKSQINS